MFKGNNSEEKKREFINENKEKVIVEKFSNIIHFFQQELIKKVIFNFFSILLIFKLIIEYKNQYFRRKTNKVSRNVWRDKLPLIFCYEIKKATTNKLISLIKFWLNVSL